MGKQSKDNSRKTTENRFYSIINTPEKASSGKAISLSSGLTVQFSQGPSFNTLEKWAKEIESSNGGVSHNNAINREQQVVSLINSGKWSVNAYHEYQRLVAGSGNVDSARLLLDYGVGLSVNEASLLKNTIGQIFKSISQCKFNKFLAIVDSAIELPSFSLNDGTTPLIAAVYSNCLKIVDYLLVNGSYDVDEVGANGLTALMTASTKGYHDLVKLLISKGQANVNYAHKFAGNTALHMAAEMGHHHVLNTLCKHGADASLLTTTGSTPVHVYASVGENQSGSSAFDIISSLILNCSANISALLNNDTTALYMAAQNGHATTVDALIQYGADINFAMPLTSYTGTHYLTQSNNNNEAFYDMGINSEAGNGASALHAASEEGHLEVVRVFIKYSSHHNCDNGRIQPTNLNTLSMRVSPLHSAAQYNHPKIVDALIAAGAKVDILSENDGATALYYAVGHGHLEVIDVLIKHNASLSLRQKKSGGFPLLYAVIRGRLEVVHKLVAAGAPIDDFTVNGLSPIHAAATSGYDQILDYLLQQQILRESSHNKVMTSFCNLGPDKDTILLAATRGDHFKTVQVILKHYMSRYEDNGISSCDIVNTRSEKDFSLPIHIASLLGNSKIIELLIQAGCDVNAMWRASDIELVSPLILAIRSKKESAVKTILTHGGKLEMTNTVALARGSKGLTSVTITALLVAIDMKLPSIVDILLGYGSDPNHGVRDGGVLQSPLLLAVVRDQSQIVKMLLNSGATCNVLIAVPNSDNSGYSKESLIDLARKKRSFDTLQVLMSTAECINNIDKEL